MGGYSCGKTWARRWLICSMTRSSSSAMAAQNSAARPTRPQPPDVRTRRPAAAPQACPAHCPELTAARTLASSQPEPVNGAGDRWRGAGTCRPACPSVAVMSARPFEIVCEIEPPVLPDLTHARHQIGVLTAVSSTFLIPDNHIGRATVSSIAVAHEVQAMGGRSIACINSRDRNLLGFRRDLLDRCSLRRGRVPLRLRR